MSAGRVWIVRLAPIVGIVGVASSGSHGSREIAVADPSASRMAIVRRVVVHAAGRTNST